MSCGGGAFQQARALRALPEVEVRQRSRTLRRARKYTARGCTCVKYTNASQAQLCFSVLYANTKCTTHRCYFDAYVPNRGCRCAPGSDDAKVCRWGRHELGGDAYAIW